MKKVFDQTVRDLKREVNKKVLKVPGIEQKVLDATSNEPWGPHGSHLADIAQATRNYNEYTLIMSVLWKRINDTGKNWRHVYKALTVLEYLVGHGSERVIDEIREHAYQISTLSDFQYIDSGGRDQGSNVRKKSQALVSLVNDKERIQEVRQKAIANRDKFRGPSSTGGMYRPSSYSSPGGGYGDRYDDDRYGNRDDDRNGNGREREWGYRDDDRYGRGGDSYGRGGDRYGRDSDERYSRDGYRDDDYRGRHSTDDYQYGSRSRSSEREKDRPYEDDDHYSSRSGGGRADDRSPDERRLERKPSEPNVGAPPSYEEATVSAQNHTTTDERDGRTVATAPKASSPPPGSIGQVQSMTGADVASPSAIKDVNSFDEFDPRASAPTPPPVVVASSADADLFGIFSDSVPQNELALVPVSPGTTTFEPNTSANSGLGTTFVPLSSASTVLNQPSENPFEDAPFKAIPSEDSFVAQQQSFVPQQQGFMSQQQNVVPQQQSFAPQQQGFAPQQQGFAPQQQGVVPQQQGFAPQQQGFAPQQQGVVPQQQGFAPQQQSYTPQQSFAPQQQSYTPQQQSFAPQQQSLAPQQQSFAPQQQSSTQSFVPVASFQQPSAVPESSGPHQAQPQGLGYSASFQQPSVIPESTGPLQLKVEPVSNFEFADTFQGITYTPTGVTNVSSAVEFSPQVLPPPVQPSSDIHLQSGPAGAPVASQAAWAPQTVPPAKVQPSNDKFEPKSTVWADTLSRGLVNLNISGPKINPLADIGIDFDSINRMEKRKEKSSGTPAISTVTMGKAMGAGSGIGRAGVSGLAPPPNPMMGNGMGMGGGAGMAMGGYGAGMNRPIGMMGGMNQPMGMGMGLNMGMGQGLQMRPGVPGGYNPMMGMGGYTQQPYGGYR